MCYRLAQPCKQSMLSLNVLIVSFPLSIKANERCISGAFLCVPPNLLGSRVVNSILLSQTSRDVEGSSAQKGTDIRQG